MVALPDMVIIAGGVTPQGTTSDLLQMTCQSGGICSWSNMTTTLSEPRFGMISMLIPDEYVDCVN